jgi:hypothetical protein
MPIINIVTIGEIEECVNRALQGIRDGVAAARKAGVSAMMPEELQFDMVVIKDWQKLEILTNESGSNSETQGGSTTETTNEKESRKGTEKSKRTEDTNTTDTETRTATEDSSTDSRNTHNETSTKKTDGNG